MKRKNKRISIAALVGAMALSGWVLPACATKKNETLVPETEISGEAGNQTTTTLATQPNAEKAQYIAVTSSGVNIRSGAGGGYSALGVAEKGTLYALTGQSGSWYKTYYKNKTAYISVSYCKIVQMDKSAKAQIEKGIAEG